MKQRAHKMDGTKSRLSFWARAAGWMLVAVLGLFNSACGVQKAAPKMIKVLKNPDISVGEPKDQPSLVDVLLFAEEDANLNEFGEAAPIDVWVFQLGDDGKFMQSEFEVVTSAPRDALGSTFIDMKEVQIPPGGSKTISELELNKNTTFIGVVAGYANPDEVDWRAVEQIKAKGETYKLLTVMSSQSIIINLHR